MYIQNVNEKLQLARAVEDSRALIQPSTPCIHCTSMFDITSYLLPSCEYLARLRRMRAEPAHSHKYSGSGAAATPGDAVELGRESELALPPDLLRLRFLEDDFFFVSPPFGLA
ncbi:hypothetical protein MAR_019088 [Mya arenaria]|uniref:Uncharacterized protein n=1 Tax=Mya arenaria TaxID=6604 RepID=A0ABY7EJ27_MYAAR|nr:hypothetical protein MAR_019088 [Mya arenaria]